MRRGLREQAEDLARAADKADAADGERKKAERSMKRAAMNRAAALLLRPAKDPRVQALGETLFERERSSSDTARSQLTISVARQVADHAVLDGTEGEVSLEQAARDIAAEIRAMPDEYLTVIRAALDDRVRRGLRVVR